MKNKFMTRAIELSIESINIGGGPFGSVIVKDNKKFGLKNKFYINLNNKNLPFRITMIEKTINQNTLLTTHNSQPVF